MERLTKEKHFDTDQDPDGSAGASALKKDTGNRLVKFLGKATCVQMKSNGPPVDGIHCLSRKNNRREATDEIIHN